MKNLKQLSRTSLRSISGGFGGESTCSTTCSDGKTASVDCKGGCSTSDGNYAGCKDSADTAYCSKPKKYDSPATPVDTIG